MSCRLWAISEVESYTWRESGGFRWVIKQCRCKLLYDEKKKSKSKQELEKLDPFIQHIGKHNKEGGEGQRERITFSSPPSSQRSDSSYHTQS